MIITRNIFPVNNSGVCCANKIDSFVIAPDGILYKCWVDIGKEEKKIGTIFEPDNISNFGLLSEYFGDDKFSNPKCMKCFYYHFAEDYARLPRKLRLKIHRFHIGNPI